MREVGSFTPLGLLMAACVSEAICTRNEHCQVLCLADIYVIDSLWALDCL